MGYKPEESNNNLTMTIAPKQKPPLDKIIVKNHTESISFHNDIYLFEEEAINFLNKGSKDLFSKKKCLITDGYILIFMNYGNENIFEIGKLNEEGIFNIEMIIKSTNGFEEEKKRLEKFDYKSLFEQEQNAYAEVLKR